MRMRILAIVVAVLAALLTAPAGGNAAVAPSAAPRAVDVVDLRFATHPGFDRVVIDLRGGATPEFRDGRSRRFFFEGSGKPVPIRGAAGVWLSITGNGHDAAGNNIFRGPRLARPGFPTLKALALTGDFEGQVTFVFALRHRADYTVRHLSGPSRLVIDFQHR
ncbi:AMIN-like domain-containing (lipo)protein [Nocardioides currus]|uniref:AMIN-like domain-containing protein n=1 Tax=Nocardioides currus TaxID=2133958 RepID=A0A2R7YZP3_9ACTN|nr:hypothetical protein [Nocardioides currus]PUA81855.1 hypothetical protein C7S10_07310 [Nocardioides currus]